MIPASDWNNPFIVYAYLLTEEIVVRECDYPVVIKISNNRFSCHYDFLLPEGYHVITLSRRDIRVCVTAGFYDYDCVMKVVRQWYGDTRPTHLLANYLMVIHECAHAVQVESGDRRPGYCHNTSSRFPLHFARLLTTYPFARYERKFLNAKLQDLARPPYTHNDYGDYCAHCLKLNTVEDVASGYCSHCGSFWEEGYVEEGEGYSSVRAI